MNVNWKTPIMYLGDLLGEKELARYASIKALACSEVERRRWYNQLDGLVDGGVKHELLEGIGSLVMDFVVKYEELRLPREGQKQAGAIHCPRCGVFGVVFHSQTDGYYDVYWMSGPHDGLVRKEDLDSGSFGCGYC